MSNPKYSPRAWLYLFAISMAAFALSVYAFRFIAQLAGSGAPSLFSQCLSGLMAGFAALILYGYWAEYRADVALGAADSRPRFGAGCLILAVFVGGFVIALLVLAWKMWRP